ncbi:hypothetical protein ScPMuIL_010964 [Solemya velum]
MEVRWEYHILFLVSFFSLCLAQQSILQNVSQVVPSVRYRTRTRPGTTRQSVWKDVGSYLPGARERLVVNIGLNGASLGIIAAIASVICGIFCSSSSSSSSSSDDPAVNKPPSFTSCPTISGQIQAGQGTTSAKVTWDDPKATDPEGDSITIEQVSGRSSPKARIPFCTQRKIPKEIKILYLSFTVTVKRCSPLSWPRNGQKSCYGNNHWGTTCRFTCNDGYEVVGSDTITCGQNGAYSNTAPTCSRVQCARPEDPTDGQAVCSRLDYSFGSICSTHCQRGYTASTFRFSECQASKTWSSSLSDCEDVESPKLICPSMKKAHTDRNSNTATVSWDPPTATDNSGVPPTVELVDTDFGPGSQFPVGSTFVTYRAVDGAGNESPMCTMMVIVETLSCPPPTLSDMYMKIDCSSGNLYQWGSSCNLSCLANIPLVGPGTITCERDNSTGRGVWSWDWGEEPYCDKSDCPELKPPLNGVLACDFGIQMKWCSLLCNSEYDISPRGPNDDYFVCGADATWMPPVVPDCSVKNSPDNMYLPSEIYYYTGACGDEETNTEIRNKFMLRIDEIKEKPQWSSICSEISCDIKNVEIICGEIGRRRKKSVHRIFNRGAEAVYTISFHITSYIDSSTFPRDFIESIESAILELADVMRGAVQAGDMDIEGVEIRSDSFASAKYTEWGCPYGESTDMTQFMTRFVLVVQLAPTITEKKTNASVVHEELEEGSKNASQCLGICEPGTFSLTGLSPCSACGVGEYQSEAMSHDCTKCPPGTTTETQSTVAVSDCQDFDLILYPSGTILVEDLPDTTDGWTLVTWLYWLGPRGKLDVTEGGGISLNYSSDGLALHIETSTFQAPVYLPPLSWVHIGVSVSPALGTLSVYVGGVSVIDEVGVNSVPLTQVELKYSGPGKAGMKLSGFNFITLPSEQEDIMPFAGSCNVFSSHSHVTMSDLWDGFHSNVDLVMPTECDEYDECQDEPCGDHVCEDSQSGYVCLCSGGFTGDHCEIAPDYCIGNKCQNGATCKSADINYTCDCLPGYSGEMCQDIPVDGQWGPWIDWSECDVTCGGGIKTRQRSCDSPPPDEHGLPCEGSGHESDECNTQECPSCIDLQRPYKSFLNCYNKDGMEYCNLTCADGFVFLSGLEPKQFYQCGRQTNYEWKHVTNDNPFGDLPQCTPIYNSFPYTEEQAKDKLTENTNELACVKNQTCTQEITVTRLDESRRKRRATGTTVTISLSMNISPGDLHLESFFENRTVSGSLLEIINGVSELEKSAGALQNDSSLFLDFTVGGTTYHVDVDSVTSSGDVTCPPGSEALEAFCAECTAGTMEMDRRCVQCERGTYQDEAAQTSCKPCPQGKTTLGLASLSAAYCDIETTTTPHSTVQSTLRTTTPDTTQSSAGHVNLPKQPQAAMRGGEGDTDDTTINIVLLCFAGITAGAVTTLMIFGIRYQLSSVVCLGLDAFLSNFKVSSGNATVHNRLTVRNLYRSEKKGSYFDAHIVNEFLKSSTVNYQSPSLRKVCGSNPLDNTSSAETLSEKRTLRNGAGSFLSLGMVRPSRESTLNSMDSDFDKHVPDNPPSYDEAVLPGTPIDVKEAWTGAKPIV